MKTLIHFDYVTKHHDPLIKDSQSLVGAFHEFGRACRTYDDGFGPLWVYSHEFGPTFIVRAQSFESALECVYDEMPSVPDEEIHEAYGFDTREEFDAAVETDPDSLELTDGYSYQANSGGGSGIVNHGYYEGMQELTTELLASLRISIVVESDDDDI